MSGQFSQTTRALAADGSRLAHLVWAVAGAILLVWLLWFCFGSVAVYETTDKARIEASQASHRVDAQISGQVVATNLAIGREVKAGDILIELDSSRERLRLQEELARSEAIAVRIEHLGREIAARESARSENMNAQSAMADVARSRGDEAKAAADFAKGTEERVAKLVSSGNSSKAAALKADAEARKAVADQAAWRSELKRIEMDARSKDHENEAAIESLRHTLASLHGDAASAQATLAQLRGDIERHRIKAPISGRLGDVLPFHIGAYVAEGQHLATIVPESGLIAVGDFRPSAALGRIKPGQRARLRLDGFPWAEYGTIPATVTGVGGEVRNNAVRVELRLGTITSAGISLQHGLPGLLEVAVEEASPAELALRSAGLILSGSGDRPTRIAEASP